MAITKPRTRLVNFRVSEDEFKSLREACETGGAQSISDFARHAVLGAPEKGANESKEVLGLRLALIEEKMGEVDAKLFQIARLLGDSNVVPMTRTAAFQFS